MKHIRDYTLAEVSQLCRDSQDGCSGCPLLWHETCLMYQIPSAWSLKKFEELLPEDQDWIANTVLRNHPGAAAISFRRDENVLYVYDSQGKTVGTYSSFPACSLEADEFLHFDWHAHVAEKSILQKFSDRALLEELERRDNGTRAHYIAPDETMTLTVTGPVIVLVSND